MSACGVTGSEPGHKKTLIEIFTAGTEKGKTFETQCDGAAIKFKTKTFETQPGGAATKNLTADDTDETDQR